MTSLELWDLVRDTHIRIVLVRTNVINGFGMVGFIRRSYTQHIQI